MSKLPQTPPIDDEAMESKLIALALKQAETQLAQGTASSQVVTHFLRLGSERAKVEVEKLKLENQLLEEKIIAEQSGAQILEAVNEVITALKSYSYTPPNGHDVDIY